MRQIWRGLRDIYGNAGTDFAVWKAGLTGTLSPQQARQIVGRKKGPLILDGIHELSPETAEVLALHDDDLRLPSLRVVSVGAAQCLARHRQGLFLDGCHRLSPAAARALAVHGLETVRDSIEESLIEQASWDSIPRLFSETDGEPYFFEEGLRKAIFVRVQPLSLSGLRHLTPRVAQALGEHKGVLILDGLKHLSDAAAEGLGNHFGSLDLNGLRSLSPQAARALAHGGGPWPECLMLDIRLRLNGLRRLSPEAAGELAQYQGTLWLSGLREITPSLASALAWFSPRYSLDRLNLYGVRRLSPEAARNLAPFSATLCLGGLTSISVELAEALVEIRGRLRLSGIRNLSPAVAEILLSRPDVYLSSAVF